ncbi:AMP-binding protein [Streptomyces sp. NPDC054794]
MLGSGCSPPGALCRPSPGIWPLFGAIPRGRLLSYEAGDAGAGGGDRLAYVLFTSGTTGRPKGIPIAQRQVVPFIEHSIVRFGVGPSCRMSHTFDLTFDPSVYDLFVTWGAGRPVGSCPSWALTEMAEGTENRATELRHSHFGGEQLTYGQARMWHDTAPHARIDDGYGPSEVAIAAPRSSCPGIRRGDPAPPTARCPSGAFAHLDSLVVEETGELCVRGPQRFDGYLDPRDGTGRFLDHTGTGRPGPERYFRTGDRVSVEDGQLVHLGRLDDAAAPPRTAPLPPPGFAPPQCRREDRQECPADPGHGGR